MIQEIIVYIIGGAVLIEIIRRIAKLFLHGKEAYDPCAGCAGCEIRDSFRRKKEQCRAEKPVHPQKRSGGCSCGCGGH